MKPFKYQVECVKEVEWFQGRALLALDPGLGKTLISLLYLQRHPEAFPAVVICPATVKYVWQREIARFLNINSHVLEGRTPNGSAAYQPKLTVINYDILSSWVAWIQKLRPNTVILDECQLIANNTKRTKAVRQVARKTKYLLALSGTPFLNRPMELYNTLNLLRPSIWSSRKAYGDTYCDPKWTPWGWDYRGASNVEELHRNLLYHCMVRRVKEQVLQDLPDKVRTVVPIPLDDPSEYRKAASDFTNWLRQQDPVKAAKASRAQSMVKVGYLLRLAAQLKLRYVNEWIHNRLQNTNEKLVVFAHHKAVIEGMSQSCKYRCVTIDGSVPVNKRKSIADQFQNDADTRVLFGNHQAAGVGITLTAASTVVIVEMTWRPGDMIQSEDRCHRIGTKDTVWVYYLVAHNTVEEKMARILQNKMEVFSLVMDGDADAERFDVFDELMKEISKSLTSL